MENMKPDADIVIQQFLELEEQDKAKTMQVILAYMGQAMSSQNPISVPEHQAEAEGEVVGQEDDDLAENCRLWLTSIADLSPFERFRAIEGEMAINDDPVVLAMLTNARRSILEEHPAVAVRTGLVTSFRDRPMVLAAGVVILILIGIQWIKSFF